jgi:hypothetical protein
LKQEANLPQGVELRYFNIPTDEKEADDLIQNLNGWLFKLEEIMCRTAALM